MIFRMSQDAWGFSQDIVEKDTMKNWPIDHNIGNRIYWLLRESQILVKLRGVKRRKWNILLPGRKDFKSSKAWSWSGQNAFARQ